MVLNQIPTNADIKGNDNDDSLKTSQTTTWLEPSLIDRDNLFRNFTSIALSNDTLFAINHPSEVVLFDITLPSNLSYISRENSYKYHNLVLNQNTLYLTYETGIAILDVSNRYNIQYLGGNHTYFNTIDHSGLTGIAVKDKIIYVGTKDNGIVVIDATNPAKTKIVGTYLDGADQSYDNMEIQGTTLYVTDHSGRSFKIIDVTNPTLPTKIEYVTFGNNEFPNGMSISDYTAYISIDNVGIKLVNITDVNTPEIILSKLGIKPVSIDVIDYFVVVSDVNNGIMIYDLSQFNFDLKTEYSQSFISVDVLITPELIFSADGLNGIKIIDYGRDDDVDGLTNGLEEYVYFTDSLNDDTDNDGIPDGEEVWNGLDPLVSNVYVISTDNISVTSTQGEDPLTSLVVILGVLLIIGSVFFYQRRQSLRSKDHFPRVTKKSEINKPKQSSVKTKVQSDSIKISSSCPSCGTSNPPQSAYCIQCGLYVE